jgi:hypothetical protein
MAELTEERVREIVREEMEKAGLLTVNAVSQRRVYPDQVDKVLDRMLDDYMRATRTQEPGNPLVA